MVAASKAAQILAQMFGKLQKYGLGKQAARSPSFGPGLQWERKGELCVLSAGACSDDKDQETRQKLFSNATLRIHYRVYIQQFSKVEHVAKANIQKLGFKKCATYMYTGRLFFVQIGIKAVKNRNGMK